MDSRISVKFETEAYEQTYKLRMGDGLENLEDIKRLVDTDFANQVLQQFIDMNRIKNQAYNRFLPTSFEDEFDQII